MLQSTHSLIIASLISQQFGKEVLHKQLVGPQTITLQPVQFCEVAFVWIIPWPCSKQVGNDLKKTKNTITVKCTMASRLLVTKLNRY